MDISPSSSGEHRALQSAKPVGGQRLTLTVVLNLVAFAYHTLASLAVLAWRAAVAAKGATYRFFEHLRTITAYVVFQDWTHLLNAIAAAAIRPP